MANKTTVYYHCHRSGFQKSRALAKRHSKMSGSCKINGFCPANISVKRKDNKVCVSYVPTHVGHKNAFKYIRLPWKERTPIAIQLASNKPHEKILKFIKGSITENVLNRIHLTTKKDGPLVIDNREQCIADIHKSLSKPTNSTVDLENELLKLDEEINSLRNKVKSIDQIQFIQKELERITTTVDALKLPTSTTLPSKCTNPIAKGKHSHPSNEAEVEIKKTASDCSVGPQELVMAALLKSSEVLKGNIGKVASLKRAIRRQRQKLRAPISTASSSMAGGELSQSALGECSTSATSRNQGDVKNDDSLPSHSGAWEIESSSTTRPPQDTLFVEPADIKHEEELILEDYGEPEEMTVGEISDGKGADNISCEDPFYHQIKQEPPEETPFETVYCGDSAMEIKQEFDDEADTPANSDGSIDQMWEELPPKKIKPSHRISLISASTKKKNLKRSKQNDKYLQCEICHQYLFSQSAFVKHYITNHEGDKETNPPSVPTYLVSSQGSKPPIKPPGESLSTDSSDSLENISVSLKNVPLGKRNSSKDKIVELVNFIAKDDDLDPSSIKFVILNC